MKNITRAMLAWPALQVGTGPALTKEGVADRLGISIGTIHSRLSRTARGRQAVAFPPEDGWAFPPAVLDSDAMPRLQPVPYWYERTVVAYGRTCGDLDDKGKQIVKGKTAAAAA